MRGRTIYRKERGILYATGGYQLVSVVLNLQMSYISICIVIYSFIPFIKALSDLFTSMVIALEIK